MGLYCLVMSFIASCAATPPIYDATVCNSDPPNEQL